MNMARPITKNYQSHDALDFENKLWLLASQLAEVVVESIYETTQTNWSSDCDMNNNYLCESESPSCSPPDTITTSAPSCHVRVKPNKRSTNNKSKNSKKYCGFCFTKESYTQIKRFNRELSEWADGPWSNHRTHNDKGEVTCPLLFGHVCQYCGATGAVAHTERYCPVKKRDELGC